MSQIPEPVGLAPPPDKVRGNHALWRRDGRYNYVVCTLNVNAHGDPSQVFAKLLGAGVSFIHAGREEGSHKHWQCYFEAPSNWETKRWEKLLPRGHFAQAKGTGPQCIDYQSKEDEDPYVFGSWRNHGRNKGARTDLLSFVKAVRTGASDAELFSGANATAMIKYPAAASRVRSAFAPMRSKLPTTRFVWGDTGTGKTYQAVVVDKAEKVRMRFPFLIGYTGTNRCIVFDEFQWCKTDIEDLLELLDEHNVTVEVKGATLPFNAELIYFCSNTDPATWYPKAHPEQRAALLRRITEGGGCIMHCTTKYKKGGAVAQPSLFQAWKKPEIPVSTRPRARSPLRARTPSPTGSQDSEVSAYTAARLLRREEVAHERVIEAGKQSRASFARAEFAGGLNWGLADDAGPS